MADFVPHFFAMATGIGRGRICMALFNSPTPKTPCYTQRSREHLAYKPSYKRFCLKFRCHGNGGVVVVKFIWRYSIVRPRKPPVIHKDFRDISYTRRVIAAFLQNFVAMATGVSRSKICLASFNSPTPKTPC